MEDVEFEGAQDDEMEDGEEDDDDGEMEYADDDNSSGTEPSTEDEAEQAAVAELDVGMEASGDEGWTGDPEGEVDGSEDDEDDLGGDEPVITWEGNVDEAGVDDTNIVVEDGDAGALEEGECASYFRGNHIERIYKEQKSQ